MVNFPQSSRQMVNSIYFCILLSIVLGCNTVNRLRIMPEERKWGDALIGKLINDAKREAERHGYGHWEILPTRIQGNEPQQRMERSRVSTDTRKCRGYVKDVHGLVTSTWSVLFEFDESTQRVAGVVFEVEHNGP